MTKRKFPKSVATLRRAAFAALTKRSPYCGGYSRKQREDNRLAHYAEAMGLSVKDARARVEAQVERMWRWENVERQIVEATEERN